LIAHLARVDQRCIDYDWLGQDRATNNASTTAMSLRKRPVSRSFPIIGAPRFELGTSSPPDCSGKWRRVSGRGGKWLHYCVSGHRPHSLSQAVSGRLGTDWALGRVRFGHLARRPRPRHRGSAGRVHLVGAREGVQVAAGPAQDHCRRLVESLASAVMPRGAGKREPGALGEPRAPSELGSASGAEATGLGRSARTSRPLPYRSTGRGRTRRSP
jgi:hypothetical protein